MKKAVSLYLLVAVSTLLVAVLPAAAGDDGQETTSRFCSTYGDLGLSHGACVALFTNSNVVPHDTSICKIPGIREGLNVENVGQCVKALKDLKND